MSPAMGRETTCSHTRAARDTGCPRSPAGVRLRGQHLARTRLVLGPGPWAKEAACENCKYRNTSSWMV